MIVLGAIGTRAHRAGADAPSGRYTLPGDGTVVDTKTQLTWQRVVPGSTFNWTDAMTYCQNPGLPGTGWRLPSVKELQTIVDVTLSNPAIDGTAFPGTPVDTFWTSSPVAGGASQVWAVNFADGTQFGPAVSTATRVRCVR